MENTLNKVVSANKLQKAKAALLTSNLLVALMTAPVNAEDVSKQVWTKAFKSIAPILLNIIIPAALLICAGFLIAQIVRCYKDYKQTGEVNYGPLIVLIAIIAFLLVLRSNGGTYLFKIVGMDNSGNVSDQ